MHFHDMLSQGALLVTVHSCSKSGSDEQNVSDGCVCACVCVLCE